MPHKTLTPQQWRARLERRARIIKCTRCPDCAAGESDQCYRHDRGGKRRKSPHIARVRLYQAQIKE